MNSFTRRSHDLGSLNLERSSTVFGEHRNLKEKEELRGRKMNFPHLILDNKKHLGSYEVVATN